MSEQKKKKRNHRSNVEIIRLLKLIDDDNLQLVLGQMSGSKAVKRSQLSKWRKRFVKSEHGYVPAIKHKLKDVPKFILLEIILLRDVGVRRWSGLPTKKMDLQRMACHIRDQAFNSPDPIATLISQAADAGGTPSEVAAGAQQLRRTGHLEQLRRATFSHKYRALL